jgi:hypothetical protein
MVRARNNVVPSVVRSQKLYSIGKLSILALILATIILVFYFLVISEEKNTSLNQNQQLASPATCSVLPVGTTTETPKATIVRPVGAPITTNHLDVTLKSTKKSSSGLVSANFRVTNLSNSIISSELYSNTGAIGGNGSYYYACLGGSYSCLYDVNSLAIEPGQSQTTCVTFLLPKNIPLTEIEYVPEPGSDNNFASSPVLWLLQTNSHSAHE